MIERIISWSTHNRFFVWIGILLIIAGGVWSVMNTPVDAIPDLSVNQVIRDGIDLCIGDLADAGIVKTEHAYKIW